MNHDSQTSLMFKTAAMTSVCASIITNMLGTLYRLDGGRCAIMGNGVCIQDGGPSQDNCCKCVISLSQHAEKDLCTAAEQQ